MQGMSGNKACPGTDGETKPAVDNRLPTGLSPVYHWFISGTRSALSSWLLTSRPSLFCPCKACPGKRFTGTTKRRYPGLQPGTKSDRGPVDQPLTNRGSTTGQPLVNRWFRSCVGLHRISFVRVSLEGNIEGYLLAESTRRRLVLRTRPRPFSPPRRAPPRPDRLVVFPGFGFGRFKVTNIIQYAFVSSYYV